VFVLVETAAFGGAVERGWDMPKYLMLIVENEAAFEGVEPGSPKFNEVMQMHHDFSAAVEKSGAKILGGEALLPVATATFLRNTRTSDVTVVDNPAPDLKEVLGGYYLIDAAGDDQARELAEQCPAPSGYIELRPVWDIPSS
jgi:hypothetical protein